MAATTILPEDNDRFEELATSDDDEAQLFPLPPWLSSAYLDTLHDDHVTITSQAQSKTQSECMPLLKLHDSEKSTSHHGLPPLDRKGHIRFLHKVFDEMPAPYEAMDAARPWFFYWALQGLTILGEDVSQYGQRLRSTVKPLQNKSGGFAGGHGQQSHCATSYACTLALAMVDALDVIDRRAMWHFLGQVKQADGGFKVATMAEEDIRGAYCAMTILSLLRLPLELPPDAPARQHGLTSFLDGLGEWIRSCQTYEGGIGGVPGSEAHGAYAFCALACLSLMNAPAASIPRYLDVPALVKWIVDMQTSPEGGFAGRTNKLVDACYSHWTGGCWSLLEAAMHREQSVELWNREALIRYLLTCCQQPGKKAGMRDKPSTRPDAYHTCYSLAGLSAAQNRYTFDVAGHEKCMKDKQSAPFQWTARHPGREDMVSWKIESADLVQPVHPVFVIPFRNVRSAQTAFEDKQFRI